MNAPFTNTDRQAGHKAMEESLTPLVKALRKFSAGAPLKNPGSKSTPMGAVMLVSEQRKRLEKVLADEKVKGARITSAAVVIRVLSPSPVPADTVLVKDGKEGEAVQLLQQYPVEFAVVGVMFAVQGEQEKRPFAYLIDRTLEGKAALEWAWDRQLKRTPRKNMS